MKLSEKVAYLKGLEEGLDLASQSAEGKLLKGIIDAFDEIVESIETNADDIAEINDRVDEIDLDLGDLENFMVDAFGMEDEEDDEPYAFVFTTDDTPEERAEKLAALEEASKKCSGTDDTAEVITEGSIPAKETAPEEEAATEEAPVEEAPAEEAAAEPEVVEEAPAEEAVAEPEVVEEAPAEEAAAEPEVVEEAPAEEAAAEPEVVEEAPAEEAVAEPEVVEEAPVEEAPAEEELDDAAIFAAADEVLAEAEAMEKEPAETPAEEPVEEVAEPEAPTEEVTYEVECPSCGNVMYIDDSILARGGIECPKCHEKLEFEIEYED